MQCDLQSAIHGGAITVWREPSTRNGAKATPTQVAEQT
jgi:hypothetical protein